MEEKANLTKTIPIVAMRGSVVFPHTDSFLSFGRQKSVSSVTSAFSDDRMIAVFNQKDSKIIEPLHGDLYEIGTLGVVTQMMNTDDGIHALVQGKERVKLEEIITTEPFLIGKVRILEEKDKEGAEVEALAKEISTLFQKAVNLGKGVDVPTIMKVLSRNVDAIELVDSVSSFLEISAKEKQALLAELSVQKRLKKVHELLSHEVNVLDLENVISQKTQKRFEDQMRKAMLIEKKRTIEQELGGNDAEDDSDTGEYKKKIKDAQMPKEVRKKALKELKRLSQMSPQNPEHSFLRNYLDWLVDMPWNVYTSNDVEIKKAEAILDSDHYALGKAKERILEYLSVIKLKEEKQKNIKSKKTHKNGNGEHQPTILCFVGPPGVGKTSIGRSIAKSLGRKFVRVSLGGVRDEAELRGHRRTYVGALPGRIIQGIKNSKAKNPVFMLDEIDKLGADYRGDPASALLEILDPEQNKEFSDHYLEVPFDLSEVMFICTANVLDSIPLPLLDRMEVINFAGYIEDEKYHIANKYLWPKQLKAHSLDDKTITIEKDAMLEIIKSYTREAGVRDLERKLASICRKLAKSLAEKKRLPKVITKPMVQKYLGIPKFSSRIAEKKDEVGTVTGLSVTATGGEILSIEVSTMPGKGKLSLTGQLGDVMKESAQAAFTWTRAHYKELGLAENFGYKKDIHIHVPEGGIKKDGPSAGIAMTTALVSALTGVKVKKDVAMTGEVTLRGKVLPIGGVKEKVIAAHRAGIKTVILPKENKKDLEEDVPADVKKDINFVFATTLKDVLPVALAKGPIV